MTACAAGEARVRGGITMRDAVVTCAGTRGSVDG